MRTMLLTLSLLFSLITPVHAAAPSRFLVLYSNDVHGETEPCG